MSKTITCLECGYPSAKIVKEEKYNGLRGMCPKCGICWPES